MTSSDIAEAAGTATLTAGVLVEFGTGWALIAGGLLVLVGTQVRGIAAAIARPPTDGPDR